MKAKKKPNIVQDSYGDLYFKDSSGTVWHMIKTPYKEIPIVNINWGEKLSPLKKGRKK